MSVLDPLLSLLKPQERGGDLANLGPPRAGDKVETSWATGACVEIYFSKLPT